MIYTRNIGKNRGKPRLWLEGDILQSNGFTHGSRWNIQRTMIDGNPSFFIVLDADGNRKIAGTADRPIIDINSGSILEPFAGERVTIVAIWGCLTVTPEVRP